MKKIIIPIILFYDRIVGVMPNMLYLISRDNEGEYYAVYGGKE